MTEQVLTEAEFPAESQPALSDFPSGNFPELPRKITDSPYFTLYVERARSGWSSRQLEEFAERYCGERISHVTFQALLRSLPPTERLPTHYRDLLLNGVDAQIDAVGEMQCLIAVQRERVTRALLKEAASGNGHAGSAAQKLAIQKMIDSLHTMTKDWALLQVHLGVLTPERARQVGVIDATPRTREDELRDACRSLTLEQEQILQASLNLMERMFVLGVSEIGDAVSVESWAQVCQVYPMLAGDAVRVSEDCHLAFETLWLWAQETVRITEFVRVHHVEYV